MNGNEWLRHHARWSWLLKDERDGPTPAPVPELKEAFARRHAENCRARREKLMAERDA